MLFCTEKGILRSLVISKALTGFGNPPQAVAFAIGNNNQHTQKTAERISLSLRVSLFRRSAPYGNPPQAVAFAVGNNNQHTQETAERISLSLRVSLFRRSTPYGNPLQAVAFAVFRNYRFFKQFLSETIARCGCFRDLQPLSLFATGF